jgi:hypothetical protein
MPAEVSAKIRSHAVVVLWLIRSKPNRARWLELDDGRRLGVELVGVRPDPAMLRLEDERERILKSLLRSEPDVFACAHIDVRLEHVGERAVNPRVGAVRNHES